MLPQTLGIVLLIAVPPADVAPVKPKDADRPLKWEAEIAGIEKRLAASKPATGGVVFYGSSTIRLWPLDKNFPDLKAVNAGFGGSETRDAAHFFSRLVRPLKPAKIVFYEGDNDINSGRTPEQVEADLKKFCEKVREELPETKILILAIKPSPARVKQRATQKKANALQKAVAAAEPKRLSYLDLDEIFLDATGETDSANYAKDGLHFSPVGYEKLSKAVGSWLKN